MEVRTDASYRFSDRLKGESRLELFNDHYLSVDSRRLKKRRQYKLEVATLNPEAECIEDIAWHWLAAGLLTLGVGGYFLYGVISGAVTAELTTVLSAAIVLPLVTAGFALAFLLGSERKWVFRTRAAKYPLVVVPYHKAESESAAAFVEQLKRAIEATTDKKGYSRDDLFAGEMRMLRRLSKSGIISDDIYDSAKKHMLGSNTQAAVAAG